MQLGKEKSKKIIMLMSLSMLSSCAYFRENPEELKKMEVAVESEVEVAVKASDKKVKETKHAVKEVKK